MHACACVAAAARPQRATASTPTADLAERRPPELTKTVELNPSRQFSTIGRPTTLNRCCCELEGPATWSNVKWLGSGLPCTVSVSGPVWAQQTPASSAHRWVRRVGSGDGGRPPDAGKPRLPQRQYLACTPQRSPKDSPCSLALGGRMRTTTFTASSSGGAAPRRAPGAAPLGSVSNSPRRCPVNSTGVEAEVGEKKGCSAPAGSQSGRSGAVRSGRPLHAHKQPTNPSLRGLGAAARTGSASWPPTVSPKLVLSGSSSDEAGVLKALSAAALLTGGVPSAASLGAAFSAPPPSRRACGFLAPVPFMLHTASRQLLHGTLASSDRRVSTPCQGCRLRNAPPKA